MKLLIDAHTHTIASGHAYSTLTELISSAQEKNLSILAVTEHGPNMPGTCSKLYFMNYRVIPRNYGNLKLLMGAEANILDYNGNLDFSSDLLSELDLVIASIHGPCYQCGTERENTQAYINAMKNPSVSVIGHPDDSRFPIDYQALVLAAKENHILLELNNSSLSPVSFRANAKENAVTLLSLCKEYDVPIIVNSDAHIAWDVANFSYAKTIIEETKFPEELIMNTSPDKFLEFIKS